MCGIKVTHKFMYNELRDRLGIYDIITVLQQNRLRWSRFVSRKDKNDWLDLTELRFYVPLDTNHYHHNHFTALFPGPPG